MNINDIIMAIETIFLAIIAAVFYAGTEFLKKYLKENPETFDYYKFGSTILIGIIVGASAGLSNKIPVDTDVGVQLALYGGFTVLIENVLRIGWRFLKNKVLP